MTALDRLCARLPTWVGRVVVAAVVVEFMWACLP